MVSLLLWMILGAQPFETPTFVLTVSRIEEHFYVHTSYKVLGDKPYPSNGLIAETDSGVVIVDTPWDTAQTEQLFSWIETHLGKKVSLCIVTHAHDDRIGGIDAFARRGIKVISTPLTARHAAERGFRRPEAVLPNDTLFSVGGIEMECFYPGKGHTDDNIVVWFPRQRILFGGCLVKSTDVSGLGNVADADVHSWPASIRTVMKKFPSPVFVIPGHEGWSSNKSLEHTLELLKNNR